MIISPQGEIRLLKDVPFDSNYRHTILFGTTASQLQYMTSKVSKQYSRFSYVRHSEGTEHSVKIPELADNVYDCNYMMFQNTGFGLKWFYAFVTSIEYVNNDTTRVSFVIDQWQTWITEMVIGTCYVEREHVSDDTVGKHTVPENLPTGDYICDGGEIKYDSGRGVMVQLALENDGGENQSGIFSGVKLYGASYGNTGSISQLMVEYADQPEKIALVSMTSGHMVSGGSVGSYTGSMGITRGYLGFRFQGDSYSPKNNKLYCAPYCFLTLDNFNGNCESYNWEDFNSPDTAQFVIHESPLPRPSMECYPVNYKGMSDAQGYGVIYDNFPMCPYVIDTYRAWSSQALPKAIVSTGSNYVNSVLNGGVAAAGGALLNGINSLVQTAIDNEYHKVHGTAAGGGIGGSGMNFDQDRVGFRIVSYTIKPEYARLIDDFFTRFGYKVMRYKKPNLTSRTTFNYVKTVEAIVDGPIPEEALDTIENSLNHGITLWHTTAVGNYSLRNDNVDGKKVIVRFAPKSEMVDNRTIESKFPSQP